MTNLALAPSALDALTVVRELNHRINNDFASAINIVSVGAMLAKDSEVKAALSKVVRYASPSSQSPLAAARQAGGNLRSTAAWALMPIHTTVGDPS